MASSTKSPFSELSFSEQQAQWRAFRAERLEYQPVTEEKPAPEAPARRLPYETPRHTNLDRVRAQLTNAARRAGAFQPVSAKETAASGSAPSS
ncbi:MAG: hypothetical protein IJS53_00590 [Clostridia bacterium]|nr:hypothetical protein [Clostridia bacterium]